MWNWQLCHVRGVDACSLCVAEVALGRGCWPQSPMELQWPLETVLYTYRERQTCAVVAQIRTRWHCACVCVWWKTSVIFKRASQRAKPQIGLQTQDNNALNCAHILKCIPGLISSSTFKQIHKSLGQSASSQSITQSLSSWLSSVQLSSRKLQLCHKLGSPSNRWCCLDHYLRHNFLAISNIPYLYHFLWKQWNTAKWPRANLSWKIA